ncbi:2-pyrone-4,6-dicarboxylate hydrolase [Marinobacterium zhoushanense]|uniref:2-pyrone-4,6-dicarboxylate hydrolase n=1 Tax=Marinobacterium zhoushanense TaxID=1679163 RepID=A0ABQ1JVV4_9GAMM|nr:amidohydrolase family protein [Marinobacterium zhoushanense]GGB79718.1 2-pyrone-4,6-dicarboxylate hydrolase [Marinobacterium zhoushanense]
MSVFSERKIDCHNHIFDPLRFPYQPDSPYQPSGQEIATADQFLQLLEAYGVSHALLVGPNSAYGENHNRALLDAIQRSGGRFKGMAVVDQQCSLAQLQDLKAQGIVGVTFNVAFYGVEHFRRSSALLDRLAQLDLIAQFQVEGHQLLPLADMFVDSGARLLVDHCGRPDLEAGLQYPGFQSVLALADSGRAWIKVSGFDKFSTQAFPYADTQAHVRAIQQAYGEDRLIWGSDWPFLRARQRMDYGLMLKLAEQQFTEPLLREKYFWKNAEELIGFG